jgi:hypothetical protein
MHFVNCGPALVWFQRGERKHVRRPVLGPQQFHVVFDDVPAPLVMGMGYWLLQRGARRFRANGLHTGGHEKVVVQRNGIL